MLDCQCNNSTTMQPHKQYDGTRMQDCIKYQQCKKQNNKVMQQCNNTMHNDAMQHKITMQCCFMQHNDATYANANTTNYGNNFDTKMQWQWHDDTQWGSSNETSNKHNEWYGKIKKWSSAYKLLSPRRSFVNTKLGGVTALLLLKPYDCWSKLI